MSEISSRKLASVLLQYPAASLFEGLDYLDTVVASLSPKECKRAFERFVAWLRATPPTEVAQHYVETFDLRRRCALYLTYYRYGDTRKRGMAMLAYKTAYRNADFTPPDDELPDYLPLVLEFAALAPNGELLLRSMRADLELLRKALHEADTPYAEILDGLCVSMPKLRKREHMLVGKHWETGPPHEDVGLEPFAPPEYLSGTAVRM